YFQTLHLVDVATGNDRVLAAGLATYAGLPFSWSPDGRSIAVPVLRAPLAVAGAEGRADTASPADLAVISIESGAMQTLTHATLPVLYGPLTPQWSADSSRLYAVSLDRKLWEIERASGAGRPVSLASALRIEQLIAPDENGGTIWAPGGKMFVR